MSRVKSSKASSTEIKPANNKLFRDIKISNPYQLNDKQKNILKAALDDKTSCLMIDGLYGTSKTYISVLAALSLLKSGKIEEILYVRNSVESSSTGKVGLLPGTADEKMGPYYAIFHEKLKELLPIEDVKFLEKTEAVNVMPLSFVRGHSWRNKVVIVDEAACLTFEDLILLTTRLGENSKLFLVGDSENQSDIGAKSGFRRFFSLFNNQESSDFGIKNFELKEESDIVRSEFVKFVLRKTGILRTGKLRIEAS